MGLLKFICFDARSEEWVQGWEKHVCFAASLECIIMYEYVALGREKEGKRGEKKVVEMQWDGDHEL